MKPDPDDHEATKRIAKDKATMHVNEFAADVNASTLDDSTLPVNASVDDIVNAIIAMRDRKRGPNR